MTRVVLTIGTFDMLHFGHVDFLRQAAALGDTLHVGVNTSRFAATFKPAPVMTDEERCYAIRQLGYDTWGNDGPGAELIKALKPQVLAIGSDWAARDYPGQLGMTWGELEGLRVTVAFVPYVQFAAISSSEIRRRVLAAPLPRLPLNCGGGGGGERPAPAGVSHCC